ncbi:rod shape-determining protein [Pseudoalteromonas rubra]|uniref:rod shape-determining protein n=1 Tax=Pseudoalteromonas rubra TaxID=43658 RepID=UPI000AC08653|nr:rod shape-determining protein [Pseudoalteromonas rubra]
MLKWIQKKFAPVLYVQIWEGKLKITDIKTKQIYEDVPLLALQSTKSGKKVIAAIGKEANELTSPDIQVINPFSHPRLLFSDFHVGEKILQHAFSTFYKGKFLKLTPKTVMHPMEKTEGGLTMIEVRAFREVALGAGSADSKIHVGCPLSITQFDFDKVEDIGGINPSQARLKSSDDIGLWPLLGVALFILAAVYLGLH